MKRGKPLNRSSPLKQTQSLTRRVVKAKRAKVTAEERSGRKAIAARSGGVCEIDGYHPATEAHHRKNRSQGGTWEPSNLVHSCHTCHQMVTVNPAMARERGWSVRGTDNPAQMPIFLAGQGWVLLNNDGTMDRQENAA